jgi:hypothetical protein
MMRFLLNLAYPALLVPLYLDWSRRQAEAQIDKMQRSVFNTPGAEAPLPATVMMGGIGLLVGYGLWTGLLGQRGWQRAVGLVLGIPLGVTIFSLRQAQPRRRA